MIGKHIIPQNILNDLIKYCTLFLILADEVTSNKEEHLALCNRFVDRKKDDREEFLSYLKMKKITRDKIAEVILEFLKENNISA